MQNQGFAWRLTSGGGRIFNNRLLFSILFSGTFSGRRGCDEGDKSAKGRSPQSPTRESLAN